MADLNAILNNIATAVYGEDVRGSIYDGIKFIHDEYMTIKTVADQMDELIATYEEKVVKAQELTSALQSEIDTGTSLKDDLTELNSTLSDGRDVLAQLKSENEKATSALTEAREKIPIIQNLLSRFPDLDQAEQLSGRLEEAANEAGLVVDELNELATTIEQLTTLNSEAEQHLRAYDNAKTEINDLIEKTTQLESVIEGYPEIVQALETAYQNVSEKTADLDELNRLLSEIENNVTIINENKQAVDTVATNIEIIKELSEMDLPSLLTIESRVTALEEKEDLTPRVEAIEETLAGLAETLEALI